MSITSDHIKNAIMVLEYKNKYGFYPKDTQAENITKTQYRSTEHTKLKTISSIITIMYYSFLILLMMLLFTANNILLKERWLLYLFLILLPILYPWIFMGLMSLKNTILSSENTGPKTAFIDNNNLSYNV